MKAFYHLCFVTEVIMDPKNPKNLTLINSFFLKSPFRLNPILKILYQIWSIIKTSFVSLYKNFKKFSRGHYKEWQWQINNWNIKFNTWFIVSNQRPNQAHNLQLMKWLKISWKIKIPFFFQKRNANILIALTPLTLIYILFKVKSYSIFSK